jgi:endoglycosylceramidase
VGTTGEALLLTEFGATDNAPYLRDVVARSDRLMVPWIEWAYCGCSDPTTTGPGTKQAIVVDPAKPPTGSNVVLGTLRALVEPYPQLIAGTPRGWASTPPAAASTSPTTPGAPVAAAALPPVRSAK